MGPPPLGTVLAETVWDGEVAPTDPCPRRPGGLEKTERTCNVWFMLLAGAAAVLFRWITILRAQKFRLRNKIFQWAGL